MSETVGYMNTNMIETVSKEDVKLINKLTRLLEEQINVIHRSDITGKHIENLAEKTQVLANEIAKKKLLDMEQFANQREHIQRLYNNLNLAVIARKDEIEKHLDKIRKGKKIIVTYRGNI